MRYPRCTCWIQVGLAILTGSLTSAANAATIQDHPDTTILWNHHQNFTVSDIKVLSIESDSPTLAATTNMLVDGPPMQVSKRTAPNLREREINTIPEDSIPNENVLPPMASDIPVKNQEILVAQITPDNTLGNESTVRTPDILINGSLADQIGGGVVHGANLFHNFKEFNVNTGQRVYFAAPSGIQNILSRITGENVSNIDGLLGVDGVANLFLLNPNGIIFGPNAQLDIQGSFTASTADSFSFGNDTEFSASTPEASPQLKISVIPGLQHGNQPGPITIQSNLQSSQNLTLSGGAVTSIRALITDGHLTVEGTAGNVQLQDITARSVLVSATDGAISTGNIRTDTSDLTPISNSLIGGNGGDISLTADGDISTGFLLTSSIFSPSSNSAINLTAGDGGDIILSADGEISVQYANASSTWWDVNSNESAGSIVGGQGGDITFEAGDNISILGNDGYLASSSIIRTLQPTPMMIGGDGGNITLLSGGTVSLDRVTSLSESTSQSTLDDSTGNISGGAGGDINLSAGENINITSNLVSSSISKLESEGTISGSSGGNISLSAGENILLGELSNSSAFPIHSFSESTLNASETTESVSSGTGGDIILSAGGNIESINDLELRSSSSSNSLISEEIRQLLNDQNFKLQESFSDIGGNITLLANGSIQTENIIANLEINRLNSYVDIDAGPISLLANESIQTGNITNNGEAITLNAQGNINVGNLNSSITSFVGKNGGDISLSAGGRIVTEDLTSRVQSDSANPDNADITVIGGDAGDINLSASEDIQTRNLRANSNSCINLVCSGDIQGGNGGNITLSTEANIIIGGPAPDQAIQIIDTSSDARSTVGDVIGGNSGDINFSAGENIDIYFSNALDRLRALSVLTSSGNLRIGEAGDIILSAGDNISIPVGSLDTFAFSLRNEPEPGKITQSSISDSGNGGDISIHSISGDISIAGTRLNSFSFSVSGITGDGGDISLLAREGMIVGNDTEVITLSIAENGGTTGTAGTVTLEANAISGIEVTTLSSAGQSGDVKVKGFGDSLTVRDLTLTTSAQIEIDNLRFRSAPIVIDIENIGQSGNTFINSTGGLTLNNVQIQSDANGSQPAGNIRISSPGTVRLINSQILSNTNGTGRGGNITFSEADRLILNNTTTTTDTAGQGLAGSIFIKEINALVMRNNSLLLSDAGGQATGGNITIESDFVIAPFNENNDILVTAADGRGGQIKINAINLLGFTQSSEADTNILRGMRTNDISASSQTGESGDVVLNTLDIDPSRGLIELPTLASSPPVQRGCSAAALGTSSFTVTGRGGLPSNPTDILSRDSILTDLGPNSSISSNSETNTTEIPESNSSEPIVESQGLVKASDGRAYFIAQTSNGASQDIWQPNVQCDGNISNSI